MPLGKWPSQAPPHRRAPRPARVGERLGGRSTLHHAAILDGAADDDTVAGGGQIGIRQRQFGTGERRFGPFQLGIGLGDFLRAVAGFELGELFAGRAHLRLGLIRWERAVSSDRGRWRRWRPVTGGAIPLVGPSAAARRRPVQPGRGRSLRCDSLGSRR